MKGTPMPTLKYTPEEARARKNARQAEYAKRTGYAANAKYAKDNTKGYYIRFVKKTENDMIDWLEAKDNKSGYIKDLIRADMKNKKCKITS